MGEAPFKILSHLVHSPRLVHLRHRIVIVSHRLIALRLDNAIEILKESCEQLIIESVDGQLGVVSKTLFQGGLEEEMCSAHTL